ASDIVDVQFEIEEDILLVDMRKDEVMVNIIDGKEKNMQKMKEANVIGRERSVQGTEQLVEVMKT
ncbi:hypothetical protein, partial [Aliarcobacter skirrowii]